MLRKISRTMVIACLLCAMIISPVLAASPGDGTYCGWDHSPIITPWQELLHSRQLKPVILRKEGFSAIGGGRDPEVGATDIEYWVASGGGLIEADKKEGVFNLIKSVSMSVFGSFVKTTVGQVVFALADAVGVILDQTQRVEAKTYHSFRYIAKAGLVYTENEQWDWFFESRSREVFKHTWGSFYDTQGYTHTIAIDYTRPNGYEPVYTQFAAHYNDNTYIMNRARDIWAYGWAKEIEYGY
jgi:hypothetical protein